MMLLFLLFFDNLIMLKMSFFQIDLQYQFIYQNFLHMGKIMHTLSFFFTFLVIFFLFGQHPPRSTSSECLTDSKNIRPHVQEELIQLTFEQWQQKYSKQYNKRQEVMYRSTVFLKNKIKVHNHNILYKQGKTQYYKALNRLVDLEEEEFKAIYNWKEREAIERVQNRLKGQGVTATKQCTGAIMDSPNPPTELDWTTSNKVTTPSDQGTCGKDWALVSISAVESLYAIKISQLPHLSVQQLLQCSGNYGNQGCNGGFMDQAFWYMIDSGVATVKSYPDREVSTCRYVQNMKFTGFTKCARIPSGNYSKLISAIVQQPVSVALDFSQDMALYSGGIFDGKCTTKLTHGMLLTGYGGKEHGTHYWILRNTLGTTWGQKGYIHLLKEDKDGQGKCGVMRWPSVPQNLS